MKIEYKREYNAPIKNNKNINIIEMVIRELKDVYGRIMPKPINNFASPPANAFA